MEIIKIDEKSYISLKGILDEVKSGYVNVKKLFDIEEIPRIIMGRNIFYEYTDTCKDLITYLKKRSELKNKNNVE